MYFLSLIAIILYCRLIIMVWWVIFIIDVLVIILLWWLLSILNIVVVIINFYFLLLIIAIVAIVIVVVIDMNVSFNSLYLANILWLLLFLVTVHFNQFTTTLWSSLCRYIRWYIVIIYIIFFILRYIDFTLWVELYLLVLFDNLVMI